MKQSVTKKQVVKNIIYERIIEYRETLITTVIIMIPIIYFLYILNVHHYILPSLLGNSVIFRLDIYYRYFAIIFAFMQSKCSGIQFLITISPFDATAANINVPASI